jgi:hypothetical protein
MTGQDDESAMNFESVTTFMSLVALGWAGESLVGTVRVESSYNLGMVPSGQNSGHSAEDGCELCGRPVGEDRLTRHHLLPRSCTRMMKRRKKSRQVFKRHSPQSTVAPRGPCHRNVHSSIDNADLARCYDSVAALRDHPGVRRFTFSSRYAGPLHVASCIVSTGWRNGSEQRGGRSGVV